jgi:two-component system, sensor histidine kinase and response regulator
MTASAQIFVVDDQLENIQLLHEVLKQAGYGVTGAKSGAQALALIPKIKPDLILLDIIMPDMDGIKVCHALKAQPEYQDIPIIFITAKTKAEDIVMAFEAGGVDYITKPFQPRELLARVHTHLTLKERSLQLEHLNREKNRFLATASHDLRNPLANILTLTQLIKQTNFTHIDELQPFLPIIERSALKMIDIINQLLDINRIESGGVNFEREAMEMRSMMGQVLQGFDAAAQQKEMRLIWEPLTEPAWIHSNSQLFSQIFENLISNAIKYAPLASEITVKMVENASQYVVSVRDQGPGFTVQDQERMFHQFARLSALPTGNESSTGLGLSIVKQLTTILNASLSFETRPGKGACFAVGFDKLQ